MTQNNQSVITRLFMLAVITVALSACHGRPPPAKQMISEPDPTVLRLADAADRAASALELLSSIENQRTPGNIPPLAANAPQELRRSMTIDWIGPAEPLIKQIADRASYKFYLSGPDPEVPIVVDVNTRNESLIEILRDIGLQLNERGVLKVDANEKAIELNYTVDRL